MMLVTDRAALSDAAAWVSRAVGKDSSNPVLMAVKLETDGAGLHLSAFDYEVSLSATLEAEVGEPGSALVSGHALAAYLGTTRGNEASVHLEGSKLSVEAGSSRSELPVIGSQTDYPQLPEMPGEPLGHLDAATFSDLVARLGPVTAPRGQAFDLWSTGIHLVGDGERLLAEAGTRLVLGQLSYEAAVGALDVLVPAYGLGSVSKGLRGDVAIYSDPNILGLVAEGHAVTLRLFDRKFPKIEGQLAARGPAHLIVDRDELLAALRSVSTSSNRVVLEVEPTVLTLVTFDPEKGERRSTVTETLSVESDGSGSLRASIEYLTHCLQGVNEGAVSIDCNLNDTKPAVLSDGAARFVFMTLRDIK